MSATDAREIDGTEMQTTSRWQRCLFVLVFAGLGIGLDQITKKMALKSLAGEGPIRVIGDYAVLQYAENRGGFLSLGATLPENVRFWLLTVFTGAILVGLAWLVLFKSNLTRGELVSFALLLTGGIGNLIDRIRFDGIVVDFMVLGIGSLRTGVFNVADVAIMAGIFLLFGLQFFPRPKPQGVTDESSAP
ncbi:MAG: signal peptidase II [Candidatus Hydrogenedentes bacterium]|nr:signal peptidase II [Candidatus Hydrogenedentota bacterium]